MKKSLEIRRLDIYDAVGVYTIQFLDKAETEFMDFMSKYKDIADPILKEDFNRIIAILRKIIAKGASERLFRTCESKINDRVVAIPLDIRRRKKGSGTLRLYCLRISDEVLILSNGGIKYGNAYNDNEELNTYVSDLAKLDHVITKFTGQGKIKIIDKTVILKDKLIIEI